MSSVLQDWTQQLSWKMQTVLIQSLRAPDSHFCPTVKKVSRWLRSKVLQNADTKHTFMKSANELPDNKSLEDELGYCTLHYATHLIYGLEIVAYFHDTEAIRALAFELYNDLVTDTLHLAVESKGHCEMRLSDSEEDKKKQPPHMISERPYWRG
jgi:hypothetical protein